MPATARVRMRPLSSTVLRPAGCAIKPQTGRERSGSHPDSRMMGRPLRVLVRAHDLSVAHVNDAITVLGSLGIMRDHQHGLPQLLVGLPKHVQNNLGVLGI